jgi:hypothetical protein
MPRKLRVEYSGAMYQVMSRGDRREDIFLNDVDRQDFIKTLAEKVNLGTSKSANAHLHKWMKQNTPATSTSTRRVK